MNDVVMVGGIAMMASTVLISVIAIAAGALLAYLDPKIDHGEEH